MNKSNGQCINRTCPVVKCANCATGDAIDLISMHGLPRLPRVLGFARAFYAFPSTHREMTTTQAGRRAGSCRPQLIAESNQFQGATDEITLSPTNKEVCDDIRRK